MRSQSPARPRAASLLLGLALCAPILVTLAAGSLPFPVDLVARYEPHRSAAAELGLEVTSHPIQHEIATLLLPQRKLVRDALLAGRWPHWNASVAGGMPLAAAAQAAPFWPTTLLTIWLPLGLGLSLDIAARLVFAGLGATLLARELGARAPGSFSAGLAFGLGGFVTFWVAWPLGAAATTLPWVWLTTRRLVRSPTRHTIGALAATLAVVILSGHPESILHVVGAGIVVGLGELWRSPHRRGAVAAAGVAGGLAVAATAAFLAPVLTVLPSTTAWAHRGLTGDSSVSLAAVADRLSLTLWPWRWGAPGGTEASWPDWVVPWAQANVGVTLLGLAALGLFRAASSMDRWGPLVATVLGLALGARVPGLWQLVGALPLFDRALNDRLLVVGLLGLALLAARGTDGLAAGDAPWFAPVAIAGVFLVGLATMVETSGLGINRHVALALGGLALTAVAAFVSPTCRPGWRPGLLGLILAWACLERWHEVGPLFRGHDPRFLTLASEVVAVPAATEPFRTAGVGRVLTPNLGAFADLEDLRGYDPIVLASLEALRPGWASRQPAWFDRIDDLGNPALDRLGVRYAFAPARWRIPEGWILLTENRGVRLLENPQALARAFVPVEITAGPPALDDPLGVRAVSSDPRALAATAGSVIVRSPAPGSLELSVDLATAGVVVVTEAAWPGWRATRQGASVPIVPIDHAFLGLMLPAGHSEVALNWRPRGFRAAVATSLIGLLAVVGLLVGGRSAVASAAPKT